MHFLSYWFIYNFLIATVSKPRLNEISYNIVYVLHLIYFIIILYLYTLVILICTFSSLFFFNYHYIFFFYKVCHILFNIVSFKYIILIYLGSWKESKYSSIVFSSPEECARNCTDNEQPKNCYYFFHIEFYTTVGPYVFYN